MYEQKTKENDNSLIEFIENVEHPKKREDAYKLLDIFTEASGYEAKMWGTSIIGFGKYHYKYKSGHEGEAPLVGFSPRKTKHSLYVYIAGDPVHEKLVETLGKHTKSKACIYVNKIEDIDIEVLKKMIQHTIKVLKETYPD